MGTRSVGEGPAHPLLTGTSYQTSEDLSALGSWRVRYGEWVSSEQREARVDLPPLPAPSADADERGRAVMARWVARHGAPSLEHYRRVYEQAGLEWPGDDEVCRRHFVAAGPIAGPAA
jgi:hypothetical protein